MPIADPANALVPFGSFDRLHFARFVILDPLTDRRHGVYGGAPSPWRVSLAFLGDCDGDWRARSSTSSSPGGKSRTAPDLRVTARASDPSTDLRSWMTAHAVRPTASYVNWIGRTVRQIREDARLRERAAGQRARELDGRAIAAAAARSSATGCSTSCAPKLPQTGSTLTPEPPTPADWRLRNLLHSWASRYSSSSCRTFLIVASPVCCSTAAFARDLRPGGDAASAARPGSSSWPTSEDHDFTNQFSAFGDVKPGLFRRWLVTALLLNLLDYASRHIFRRGYLTRVQTIHFARLGPARRRAPPAFASNYDGSLESYMDDFINKVAWGINVVFGNGLGFPAGLLAVSAAAPSSKANTSATCAAIRSRPQVWYKAYPGLSVADLNRNTLIRQGIDEPPRDQAATMAWLSLL